MLDLSGLLDLLLLVLCQLFRDNRTGCLLLGLLF